MRPEQIGRTGRVGRPPSDDTFLQGDLRQIPRAPAKTLHETRRIISRRKMAHRNGAPRPWMRRRRAQIYNSLTIRLGRRHKGLTRRRFTGSMPAQVPQPGKVAHPAPAPRRWPHSPQSKASRKGPTRDLCRPASPARRRFPATRGLPSSSAATAPRSAGYRPRRDPFRRRNRQRTAGVKTPR
jgi:hypothetical protein